MPYAFRLPQTSAINFSELVESRDLPALPETATLYREVFRKALKQVRAAPSRSQPQAHLLTALSSSLQDYLPYALAVDDKVVEVKYGRAEKHDLHILGNVAYSWRSALCVRSLRNKASRQYRNQLISSEIPLLLSTLALVNVLQARHELSGIDPASDLDSVPSSSLLTSQTPSLQQRTAIIQSATQKLLTAASIHKYSADRCRSTDTSQGLLESLSQTQVALSALALAEATLLAVLKDDPYPFVVSQQRNDHDREWMIKAPEIPKVRAHLFARLCLAAADHATKAEAGLHAAGRADQQLLQYVEGLRLSARAKACRFLGIDADLGGQTGIAISWLMAAKDHLRSGDKASSTKSYRWRKMKQGWQTKQNDKCPDQVTTTMEAGIIHELQVIGYLETKWKKINDTINTQPVPPFQQLMATMPSGRDIHAPRAYQPPRLSSQDLSTLKAAPSTRTAVSESSSGPSSDDSDVSDGDIADRRIDDLTSAIPTSIMHSSRRNPYY